MNARQLRHFVVLAETLNYRRAAELLHISQPPLSSSIRNLEDRLGLALFERTRRGTVLTPAGQAALESARRALQYIDQFCQTAGSLANGEAGRLRIGFVGSATYALLPRVIPQFAERYPAVELELRDSTTAQILKMLARDEIDIGLVRAPVIEPHDATLLTVEEDSFMAALPFNHPLASAPRLVLSDLAAEPFVFYSKEAVPSLHALALDACRVAGFVPRIKQQAVQVQTIVSLVESRLGVALVPSVAARHANSSVVFKPLRDQNDTTPIAIAIAYMAGKESRIAERFIDGARLRTAGAGP